MSNTEIVNETADIDDIELHEVYVYIADDNMSASVRLGKCDEEIGRASCRERV